MAKPVRAAKSAPSLPEWDLTHLYRGIDDPALKSDVVLVQRKAAAFVKSHDGKMKTMGAALLGRAIADYESMQDLLGKIGSYAQLLYSKRMNDPAVVRFYQNTQETLTQISSQLLFFTLALNKLTEKELHGMLTHPAVEKYQSWLRDLRAFKPYQLSDELEKILHEKSVTGRAAWNRMFDETLADMRFTFGKETLTEAQMFDKMSHKDAKVRKAAAEVIGAAFKEKAKLFAFVTNTLAKDKEIEDRWRGFKAPISSRNLANLIEDDVVDALLESVRASYPKLSHRYYAIKAKMFGKKSLDYWDRNAPLPTDSDRKYTWEEGKELVLTSFQQFSPTLAEVGGKFFKEKWVDAPVHVGKASGAFAHPTVPSAHPYLLVNFQGKSRDVMTLAHELGHGVHQVLSARQGALMCDTPLTLAETASVFGEQLTFREMLAREKNEARRKILIAGKVEDMLNTVVRQIAFCEFEKRVHAERKTGELSVDRICEHWMAVQRESLGPAIKLHGDYQYFWTYIPHFIHSPFYVYAYAFGDCLVNSLYAAYEKAAVRGKSAEFEKKYIKMLEAGGTLRHRELLAPFGLDAADPEFWQQGLGIIEKYIDALA